MHYLLDNNSNARYVFCTGFGSYWEAFHRSYTQGRGFFYEDRSFLKNVAFWVNDELLDRQRYLDHSHLYPGKIINSYFQTYSEEISIIATPQREGLATVIRSDSPFNGRCLLNFEILQNKDFLLALHQSLSNLESHNVENLRRPDQKKEQSPAFLLPANITLSIPFQLEGKSKINLLEIWSDTDLQIQLDQQFWLSDQGSYLGLTWNTPALFFSKSKKSTSIRLNWSLRKFKTYDELHQVLNQEKTESLALEFKNTFAENVKSFQLQSSDSIISKASLWSGFSASQMFNYEFGAGIWAGLPWFKDCWGRDTFIALEGSLLSPGMFTESASILKNFAKLQCKDSKDLLFGRLPNRVNRDGQIQYNTTDAGPRFIIALFRHFEYSCDCKTMNELASSVLNVVKGILRNFCDSQGYLTHDDADTWMDAKIDNKIPWSSRGNRAIDIQALWYQMLELLITWVEYAKKENLEAYYLLSENFPAELINTKDRLYEAIHKDFLDPSGKKIADHLTSNGKPRFEIRPNVFMAFEAAPQLFSKDIQEKICETYLPLLWCEGGIRSLAPGEEHFHNRHLDPALHHKDAAYHNGPIWLWNYAGVISTLLYLGYGNLAFTILNQWMAELDREDCIGNISELLSPQGPEDNYLPTGTYAQTWSVSELHRIIHRNFLGFDYDYSQQELVLFPQFPENLGDWAIYLPFKAGALKIEGKISINDEHIFTIKYERQYHAKSLNPEQQPLQLPDQHGIQTIRFLFTFNRVIYCCRFNLEDHQGFPLKLIQDEKKVQVNGSFLEIDECWNQKSSILPRLQADPQRIYSGINSEKENFLKNKLVPPQQNLKNQAIFIEKQVLT
jgi:glycogen debranching enzyme